MLQWPELNEHFNNKYKYSIFMFYLQFVGIHLSESYLLYCAVLSEDTVPLYLGEPDFRRCVSV